jgi:aryl-alcohol dehydrogenase-like predicted oxidoreductase
VPERNYEIAQVVIDVATEAGCTPSQVAIAWVLAQQGIYHAPLIPIIGARNLAQLNDNLAALQVKLSADQMSRLNDATKIELGFPHDYLAGSDIRTYMYAGTFEQIQDHRTFR